MNRCVRSQLKIVKEDMLNRVTTPRSTLCSAMKGCPDKFTGFSCYQTCIGIYLMEDLKEIRSPLTMDNLEEVIKIYEVLVK